MTSPWTTQRAAIALLVAAAACAPSAEAPHPVLDRSVCSHCGMLVSELDHAAAARLSDGSERFFDDLQCLASSPPPAGALTWVRASDTGAWVPAAEAAFVLAADIRGPMGGNALAFTTVAAGRRAADQREAATVADLEELMRRSARWSPPVTVGVDPEPTR